ncbi:hypothetical protein EVG20_g2419 [Dentipellis fragilis]|uniref:Uncharacterized protein n=1 Tax=Dentipellis fragilis TaxID=205917 RepID=A0A4Y9Z9S4_9AGAM|nr:hypothetical protein EVG20_g2419 [Dentipellis fragilis]
MVAEVEEAMWQLCEIRQPDFAGAYIATSRLGRRRRRWQSFISSSLHPPPNHGFRRSSSKSSTIFVHPTFRPKPDGVRTTIRRCTRSAALPADTSDGPRIPCIRLLPLTFGYDFPISLEQIADFWLRDAPDADGNPLDVDGGIRINSLTCTALYLSAQLEHDVDINYMCNDAAATPVLDSASETRCFVVSFF